MGTTAEKLKYLNETKAEIKNALETPYNVMRDYPELIKKYIDNQPTKVVTDGMCGNAVDVPVKAIETNGNIKQETTEGYNLFDKSTANIGKAIDASGNLATNSRIVTSDFIEVEANTNYFCSNVVGSNLARSTASYDENKTLIEIKSLQNVDKGDFKLLTPLKTKYVRVSFLVDDIDVSQVAKSTDLLPYEPYTGGIPSPNPDYPQEITNVGENGIKIKQSGKNLLNVPAEYTILSTEAYKKVPISLKANHTYTIKIGQINTDNTDVTSVLFNFIYNKVEISNSYTYVKLSDLKGTYTPASDVDAVFIYSGDSYAQGAKTNTTYKNLMIYEGIEDASYEPYHEPIITPINLQGNILSKVRDVKDILKINRNGEVEIKKNIGKVILDGTEKLSLSGATTDEILAVALDISGAEDGYGYSNYFVYSSTVKQNSITVYNNGKFLRFCVNKNEFFNLEAFKAWVKSKYDEGNPVLVYQTNNKLRYIL